MGVQSAGESAARILPVALWQKRGDLLAAAAWQLTAFSSKFFPDWSIGISFEIDRGALSRGGRIQCWCERTQLNSGTISDGKKLFCGGTVPSPNEGAQRGRIVFYMYQ